MEAGETSVTVIVLPTLIQDGTSKHSIMLCVALAALHADAVRLGLGNCPR